MNNNRNDAPNLAQMDEEKIASPWSAFAASYISLCQNLSVCYMFDVVGEITIVISNQQPTMPRWNIQHIPDALRAFDSRISHVCDRQKWKINNRICENMKVTEVSDHHEKWWGGKNWKADCQFLVSFSVFAKRQEILDSTYSSTKTLAKHAELF